jgi:putative transposase
MRSNDCTRSSSEGSKTQTVLPSAETAAMLFWALLASGQINMRKVDGWQTLSTKLIDQRMDIAA